MKKIKVRFKTNLSGFKTGDTAEVTEDFLRRAGNDVEVIKDVESKSDDIPQKDVKVSNKVMPKEKVKTKKKTVRQ